MSGLEISEILLNETTLNKDFRIDSAFYTTQLKRNHSLKYAIIGDCLINSQYGISISMNEEKIGYPIYRMNEIHNMLCDLTVDKYADIHPFDFEVFKLNSGDVLFNRTNSYEWVGRTGVYYPNNEATPMIFASYLVRFVPNHSMINSEYLSAFLSCKYGISEIRRRARQSINQTNVNPEEVKEIKIPLLNSDLQKAIKRNFIEAHELRLESEEQYSSAESILLSALNMNNFTPSNEPVAVKSLSEGFGVSGRLDAEYYQAKYEDYENALKTSHSVIGLCTIHEGVFLPKKGDYKYIELADIGSSGNITGCTIAPFDELPSRARRLVRSGQVIVSSIEGSLSSCALVTDDYDGAICSTGFYVVDSTVINSETLLILFKSEPIQALMKKRCSGTILTAISKHALETMPFPLIDRSIQQQISDLVQHSFDLRRQSEQLLETAKRAVEFAIEDGEDKSLKLLGVKEVCFT